MKEKEILSLLSNVGMCYRTDLLLSMNNGSHGNTATINRLNKLGYTIENELICPDTSNKKTMKTIAITSKGRARLSNILQDDDYNYKMYNEFKIRFNSNLPKDKHRELSISRIMLMFNQAGVRTFPDDKMSLPKIYGELNHTPREFSKEWMYSDYLSISNLLDTGVYYSKREILDLFKSLGEEPDSFSGTRMQGIYLDRNRTCVVFQPNIFKNRAISLTVSIESRMKAMVKKVFEPINHINQIDAIVLTNGEALIVDMGILGKHGHVSEAPNNIKEKSALHLLNASDTMFNNIYCFPHSPSGVSQLRYFASHSSLNLLSDTENIASDISGFESIPPDDISISRLTIRDTITGTRALYIPYISLRELSWVHNFAENLSIITSASLADMISHIIRKPCAIYDMDGNRIPTIQYQENGRPIDFTEHEPETPAKQYRRPKKHHVNVELTDEEYKDIKRIAKYKGTSMNCFVKTALKPYLEEQRKKYLEIVELEKQKKELLKTFYIPKL